MSAGPASTATVTRSLDTLAPRFAEAVRAAIEACTAEGLQAMVYESYRSAELQALYYTRGRSVVPPSRPVTNARSNLYSWHGYGLAVDVIHETRQWSAGDAWFGKVAVHFRQAGCRWGGEWKMRDVPHFQWGLCRPSPSDRARALLASGGMEAVWRAVGAD